MPVMLSYLYLSVRYNIVAGCVITISSQPKSKFRFPITPVRVKNVNSRFHRILYGAANLFHC